MYLCVGCVVVWSGLFSVLIFHNIVWVACWAFCFIYSNIDLSDEDSGLIILYSWSLKYLLCIIRQYITMGG